MTVDPALYRRLQERSDRLERQARILGDAFHRFAEELASLGRDLAQLETANGQEAPDATPPSPQPRARAAVETRTCTVCGEEFTRNAGERLNNFRRRRTCGRSECMRESISRNRAGKAVTRRAQKAKAPAKKPAKTAPVKAPRPPQPATAPRKPAPPIPVPQAEPTQRWQPPQRHEPVRVQPVGEPCPEHPGEVIGVFGCPACNAGRKWRERGQIAKVGVGSRP